MFSAIVSTGSYLPENIVRNEDLTQFPKTAIPLIEVKTGVRERRHAAPSETTSALAAKAAQRCLMAAEISPLDVDGIILSTSSPDRPQPATATSVQALLGCARAFAFDVNAVCSGALYALHLADGLIRSGMHQCILVIAAEVYSRLLNPRDFSTFPYFGDGAGAVLLRRSSSPGIVGSLLGADGSGADLIQVPAGGSMLPYRLLEKPEDQYFKMQGKQVFDFATTKGPEAAHQLLREHAISPDHVTCFITHQANINIVRAIATQLNVPFDRFAVNLDRYGNTASASVLIALDEERRQGRLEKGGLCLLVAFGGGLSWAATLVRFE